MAGFPLGARFPAPHFPSSLVSLHTAAETRITAVARLRLSCAMVSEVTSQQHCAHLTLGYLSVTNSGN